MKDRWFEARVGWLTPQVDIQITPFEWGVALCWSRRRVGLRVGPVAAMLWFRWVKFDAKIERV